MKTLPVIIVFILIFCSSITGQVPDSVKFKSLLPYDFHLTYLKEDRAILIDVREFFEFRKARLKDAVNVPSSGNLGFAADTIDKQCALFLYCTSGYRSKRVAGFFHDKGFRKLYSLEGGIVAWKKDGMPVVRKKVKGTGHKAQDEKDRAKRKTGQRPLRLQANKSNYLPSCCFTIFEIYFPRISNSRLTIVPFLIR